MPLPGPSAFNTACMWLEGEQCWSRVFSETPFCSVREHLHSPRAPARPAQVICWVLGEYGRLAARCGVEGVMDRLAAIPETQTADDEVRSGERCVAMRVVLS